MRETKSVFKFNYENESYFGITHKYGEFSKGYTFIYEDFNGLFSIIDADFHEKLATHLLSSNDDSIVVTDEEFNSIFYFYRNRELGLDEKFLLLYKDLDFNVCETFELLGDYFIVYSYPDSIIKNLLIVTLFNDGSIDAFYQLAIENLNFLFKDALFEKLLNICDTNISLFSIDSNKFLCIFKPINDISYCTVIGCDEEDETYDNLIVQEEFFFKNINEGSFKNISSNIDEFLDQSSIDYYKSYSDEFIKQLIFNLYERG